ncbi:hypothetical protein MLD38_014634 [Melastoma candidum]|uniref:Uncharacterized protein n=1 Tax=Melastoma candidum TaxID=119954 RepID=A0ACB9RFA7_9MYRT|nr:hypothetical protein MLD38_014634 [Melastoma candidum]
MRSVTSKDVILLDSVPLVVSDGENDVAHHLRCDGVVVDLLSSMGDVFHPPPVIRAVSEPEHHYRVGGNSVGGGEDAGWRLGSWFVEKRLMKWGSKGIRVGACSVPWEPVVKGGFTFEEVISVPASSSMVSCCDFSSDGKLLATGGHDKKVVLWYADTLKQKNILDEHVGLITDVRFSPSMPRLATSSFDKTVRVWDADNQGFSLRNFAGHAASVMSLDFHPNKDDLICSCDSHGETRYWSVNNGSCMRVFQCKQGGMSRVRFQPRHGRFLAAVAESFVSILDVETGMCTQTLQGAKPILSICWDTSGELLASVSEDLVRVWRVGSGSEWDCLHELNCSGNKFHSCVFHPSYPSLLVIGCSQSLELWNMANNKTMTMSAHAGLIASLAASPGTGLVASASHDKMVKLWK